MNDNMKELKTDLKWFFGIILTVVVAISGIIQKSFNDRINVNTSNIEEVNKQVRLNANGITQLRLDLREHQVELKHIRIAVEKIETLLTQAMERK